MNSLNSDLQSHEENLIKILYHKMLNAWNKQCAADIAELFTVDGTIVGIDGSEVRGKEEIGKHLASIFFDHPTGTYISKIRNIKWLTPDVAILSAIVGMVPPHKSEINPDMNAIQTLMTCKQDKEWKIAFFQNTPATFQGQSALTEKLTRELREVQKIEPLSQSNPESFFE